MSVSNLVYVDATGYHYADYPAVLDYFKSQYRSIYGDDVYLEPDSQDGQWVAIMAQAIYDCFALGAATYNSFSPSTAQSDALSRNVRINGIRRRDPSFSSVDLVIVGQAGTEIRDGFANDDNNIRWNLPPTVVVPLSGSLVVTATASEKGSVQAVANSITKIGSPTRGWQSVNNPAPAVAGVAVEEDAELRVKQKSSTALPSLTVLDGISGAVANVPGVIRHRPYENDTKITNSDGIPGNTIALVVEGGDVQNIASAIASKKAPGTGTFGDVSAVTYDKRGIPNIIKFLRPTLPEIKTKIKLKIYPGYTNGYESLMAISVSDYYNSLNIGDDVSHSRAIARAILGGQAGLTYDVVAVELGKDAGPMAESSVVIAFSEAALGLVSNVIFEYV